MLQPELVEHIIAVIADEFYQRRPQDFYKLPDGLVVPLLDLAQSSTKGWSL